MKSKAWILWLFLAIDVTGLGVMDLIEKKYLMGSACIAMGVSYIVLSIVNYKGRNKSNKKDVSDIDLENMDNDLRNLIAEGERIKAIKKCRMVTGFDLKEAMEYVDLLSGAKLK